MPLSSHRAAYFLAVLALLAAPFVRQTAADDLTREEIAQLVLDRYRENYAPVTTIQATVKTMLGSFEFVPTPPDAAKAADDKPIADAPPNKSRLEVGAQDQAHVMMSSVLIAGVNERYETRGNNFGPLICLRKGNLELKYKPTQFATLNRFEGDMGRGELPLDPRLAMLWDRMDTMQTLLQPERIERAEIFLDADGKRVARVVANCASGYVTVLECPEANAFLPTRTFHIDHSGMPEFDGVVMRGMVVTYDRHIVGEKTVLFPKVTVIKSAARTRTGERPRETEGYMQLTGGQDSRTTVTELKLNGELSKDAFDCPSIVPGTRIGNNVGPDSNRIPADF